MTFVVIIASKGRFHVIGDTMFSDDIPVVYSMNNQKVFFSSKHRIGMCISDHMLLVHKDQSRSDVFVNHILRQFFLFLDSLEDKIEEITQFNGLLNDYVREHYPDYHNYFKFQQPGEYHPRDCYYFLAGFHGNSKETSVLSHFNGHEIIQAVPGPGDAHSALFVSNHQKELEEALTLSCARLGVSIPEILANHFDAVLYCCIPIASESINKYIKPYNVGPELHCVSISSDGTAEDVFYRYSANLETKEVICERLSQPISYVQSETLDDEMKIGEERYIWVGKSSSSV